jgi:hypothetical protein
MIFFFLILNEWGLSIKIGFWPKDFVGLQLQSASRVPSLKEAVSLTVHMNCMSSYFTLGSIPEMHVVPLDFLCPYTSKPPNGCRCWILTCSYNQPPFNCCKYGRWMESLLDRSTASRLQLTFHPSRKSCVRLSCGARSTCPCYFVKHYEIISRKQRRR